MSASLTMSRVERERENSSTAVPLLQDSGEDDFLTEQRRELEDSFESTGVVLVQTSTNGPHVSFFRRHRITILVTVILFLLLISSVLAALLARKSCKARKPEPVELEQEYCLSVGCIDKANYMIKAMDRQANPCKDFFQYSCGGWQKKHRIPESEAFWGVYSAVWEKNQALMKGLLDDLQPAKTTSTAEQKAKVYYDACMNLTEVNRIGNKPLQDIIRDLGGWNINTTRGKNFSFAVDGERVLQKIQKDYGVGVFFLTYVETDDKNSSKNVILVSLTCLMAVTLLFIFPAIIFSCEGRYSSVFLSC